MRTYQKPLFAYTDYPFKELGDVPGQSGPVRKALVLGWDHNKYCEIEVEGLRTEIKAGYLIRNGKPITWKNLDRRFPLTKEEKERDREFRLKHRTYRDGRGRFISFLRWQELRP